MKTPLVFASLILGTTLLVGCASTPQSPEGAGLVRNKLTVLQSHPVLANKAPSAMEEAELAVRAAEIPISDSAEDQALGAHRVYLADRQVEIAMARAAKAYAEEQRELLGEARARSRLEARTQEADRSRARAEQLADERTEAKTLSDAEAARLQRQIDELKAEATDRGLVLTLGDLLFETGSAELKAGDTSNVGRLARFLREYPERNALIEGHTDNTGSVELNQRLSERRAEAVKAYLVQQGIDSRRLTTRGLGQDRPLASNDSPDGRRSNRRVEIIIDNPPAGSAT